MQINSSATEEKDIPDAFTVCCLYRDPGRRSTCGGGPIGRADGGNPMLRLAADPISISREQ